MESSTPPAGLRAEIIAIGDELTSGQRLDTNSQWLAERLTEAGIEVVYHTTVADDLGANERVFRGAVERADVVVATGGLGPTADDLTREALASVAGVELVTDPEQLALVESFFASRGRSMPPRNAVQAQFPRGATPIPNPTGTAPGVELRIARAAGGAATVFALPGVPAEMHGMWAAWVAPAVRGLQPSAHAIRHFKLKCFGVGESQLEAMLPDMIRRGREPQVGITVSGATITLRVTAHGADNAACEAAARPTLEEIRGLLGVLVFGEGEDELEDAVARELQARGATVAACEGVSAGLLSGWLREADPAGAVFVGGETLGRGATAPTAADHAQAVRERLGATYGLAVGHERPQGETLQVEVALVGPRGAVSKVYPSFGGSELVRLRSAKLALNLLRLHLLRIETD